jgi:hypothetical protein
VVRVRQMLVFLRSCWAPAHKTLRKDSRWCAMAAPFSAELFAFVRGEQSLGLYILRNRPREELVTTQKGSPAFRLPIRHYSD